jgi:alkaline phosphatase D
MMKKIIFLSLILCSSPLLAQIIAGPMLGYVEHREAAVWIELEAKVNKVAVQYWPKESILNKKTIEYKGKLNNRYNPITFILPELLMNTTYQYQFEIDGKVIVPSKLYEFRTKDLWEWRKPAPDFKFLYGSCVYLNDSIYDRPGKPYGKNTMILEKMADIDADFNIWGGDNLYLREADYSSASGIEYRYSHDRANKQYQRVLEIRPNYAIWDDHDYGPNDSNHSFDLKQVTYNCHKNYFPQRTYGNNRMDGIYQTFKYSDAQFFMMDDRFFRSANEIPGSINGKVNDAKSYYGKQQLDWLKSALISSNAVFKLIVNGGQVLNTIADKECLRNYDAEFNEIINFIVDNKITGVLFLTGDRHFSEMHKIATPGFYDLYDFTCSPITSGVFAVDKSKEFVNPTRVEGSLFIGNNFSRIGIAGPKNERKITFEIFDQNGEKKWEHTINQAQLALPKE